MNDLIIKIASREDLPDILDVQKKAFLEVARTFHIKSLPPLEQTIESLIKEFEKGTILKAAVVHTPTINRMDSRIQDDVPTSLRGRETTETISCLAKNIGIAALLVDARNDKKEDVTIVGSVRVYRKDDTSFIGKLVVVPEYQNEGIGKALMREIENQYKNIVNRYELFTGSRDPRKLDLYDRLGYKRFKTEKLNEEVTFVYLEKRA